MDISQFYAALCSLVLIGGATLALFKWLRKFNKTWEIFMRDWQGEPAAPGRDAVPGVMARLNNIDGELKHNGGSTMKDAVKRIERTLENIEHRLIDGDEKFKKVESEISEIKKERK